MCIVRQTENNSGQSGKAEGQGNRIALLELEAQVGTGEV